MYFSRGFRLGLALGVAIMLIAMYSGDGSPLVAIGGLISTVVGGIASFIGWLSIPPELILGAFVAYGVGWWSGVNWTERKRATFDGEDAMARRSRHRGIDRDLPKRPPTQSLPRENL